MDIKGFIKKNSKHIAVFSVIAISIISILLISSYQLDISEKVYTQGYEFNQKDYKYNRLKNVQNGSVITQEFVGKYNNLEKIQITIKIDEEQENLEETLRIVLKDENNNIIKEDLVGYDMLAADSTYDMTFKKQSESKKNLYKLSIEINEKDAELGAPSGVIIKDSEKNIEGISLNVNGEKIEGSILIKDKYRSNTRTLLFNLTAVGVSILAFAISILIYFKKNITSEKAFLMIVPIICILFIIYMPMFRANDEYRHWLRAYEISEGHFLTEVKDGQVGTSLPSSIKNIYSSYKEIRYQYIEDSMDVDLNSNEKEIITELKHTATYSPVQYLPAASGIALARIFTDKVIVMAYFARLTNFLVCAAIMYMAIKIIPYGKKILLLICIIPIVTQGIATISADGITTAMSLLCIAYILKLKEQANVKINLKDKIILALVFSILSLCKVVYVMLILLLLVLPKDKFKSKKDRILSIILIALVVCIVSFGWLTICNKYAEYDEPNDLKINSVVTNPIQYLKMFLYSINYEGQTYINLTFGGKLGWGRTTDLYMLVPYTIFIMFLLVSTIDETIKNKFTKFDLFVFLTVTAGVIALVFLAMYITYTPWDNGFIKGVQGRYFSPILPLIFLGAGSLIKVKTEHKEENVVKLISIISIILEVSIVLSLVIVHLR